MMAFMNKLKQYFVDYVGEFSQLLFMGQVIFMEMLDSNNLSWWSVWIKKVLKNIRFIDSEEFSIYER